MIELKNKINMKIAHSFSQAAATYDAAAILQREVGERLFERLSLIKQQPATILDVGAGTGHFARLLEKKYRKAHIILLDIAQGMLEHAKSKKNWLTHQHFVCTDAQKLALADNSIDLIFSNLTFQWCTDIDEVFKELHRVLKPGGSLFFTTVGPDTLKELRYSWQAVDNYQHVNQFLDMHDVGDALVRQQFSDAEMDMEHFTLTYPTAFEIMRELKALGTQTILQDQHIGLTGKTRFAKLVETYETFRNDDGRLPATYEIIYGHAWKTEKLPHQIGNEVHIPVSSIMKKAPK